MEDDLFVSSGTRAFQEQPLDDDRQTGKGMASLRWGESAHLRVAIVRLGLAPHHRRLGLRTVRQGWRQHACSVVASDEGGSRLHSVERESKLFEKRPPRPACWSVVPDRSESDLRRRELHILHPGQWNDSLLHDKQQTGDVFQHQHLCIKPLGTSSEWKNQRFDCWT